MKNGTVLTDNQQFSVALVPEHDALLFDWKYVEGLSVEEFRSGIVSFAKLCETHRPFRAVIDARKLDQTSPAIEWLRSRASAQDGLSYDEWWLTEVVPTYHTAGITGLSIATGDPNAPGQVPVPPGVNFKMGYLSDLGSAYEWPSRD